MDIRIEAADEGELRRRLDVVLGLHTPVGHPKDQMCRVCMNHQGVNAAWPCRTVRAVRGET
jgi:hypothetical protein